MKHNLNRLSRFLCVLIGALIGLKGASFAGEHGLRLDFLDPPYLTALFMLGGGFLGFGLGPLIVEEIGSRLAQTIAVLHKTPTVDMLGGAMGLVAGLIIAILVTIPLPSEIPMVGDYLPVLITLLLGYLGASVGLRKRSELAGLFFKNPGRLVIAEAENQSSIKVLDTSVIIDGRIADITKSGFVEGPLIVPSFVLEELQHIADSSDVLKRNRGRRGLDILNKMQKEPYVTVEIMEREFDEISEVDSKLVKLAKELGGRVITNDFNLNKVCELQGVMVLNINELANAVKPIVLPGEELRVHVIKDGKEQGQGVAYLDDGTMIVVDGGRRFIGETIGVLVTSVLQTAAGRMIFAKPKAVEKAL